MSKKYDLINIINYKNISMSKRVAFLNADLENKKIIISSLKSNVTELENLNLLSTLPRLSNELSAAIALLTSQSAIISRQISENRKQIIKLSTTLEALKEIK